METIDLQFFLEPPVLNVKGLLTIEALAPLSMVAAQPGKYYRSQPKPTDFMLYGLVENALGWHLHESMRKDIMNSLKKQLKKKYKNDENWKESSWITDKAASSEVGFVSLLQYHLTFEFKDPLPNITTYDDLWSQQLRDTGRSFFGGSKHYDYSLSAILNRAKKGEVSFGDLEGFGRYGYDELDSLPENTKINYKAIRSKFPQYYISPTVREYVIPESAYQIDIYTTPTVSKLLHKAFEESSYPLYLGANDGWVEVNYYTL